MSDDSTTALPYVRCHAECALPCRSPKSKSHLKRIGYRKACHIVTRASLSRNEFLRTTGAYSRDGIVATRFRAHSCEKRLHGQPPLSPS